MQLAEESSNLDDKGFLIENSGSKAIQLAEKSSVGNKAFLMENRANTSHVIRKNNLYGVTKPFWQ